MEFIKIKPIVNIDTLNNKWLKTDKTKLNKAYCWQRNLLNFTSVIIILKHKQMNVIVTKININRYKHSIAHNKIASMIFHHA